MEQQRLHFKQLLSLAERLDQEAERLRTQAYTLSRGSDRDMLIRKARQLDTASHVDEWLSSPGLRAPH